MLIIHVMPDDLRLHERNADCPCEPEVIYEDGITVYLHYHYGSEEAVEWANEILKKDETSQSHNTD